MQNAVPTQVPPITRDSCLGHAPGTELHRKADAFGAAAIVKKVPSWSYLTLSPIGLALWDALDGERNVVEIYHALRKTGFDLSPAETVALLARFQKAGFVESADRGIALERNRDERGLSAKEKNFRLHWRHPLSWDCHFAHSDAFFSFMYRYVTRWLLCKPVLILLFICTLAQIAVYRPSMHWAPDQLSVATFFTVMLGAFFAGMVHECAHAIALKHCGLEVGGIGIGWFWFGPSLSVDTSDSWLGTRRQRIVISMAGPFMDALLASSAIFGAQYALPDWALILNALGVVLYFGVVFNLCPFVEHDGYHILIEVLQHRNLKQRAQTWTQQLFREKQWRRSLQHRHGYLYAGYGISAALWLLLTGAFSCIWLWHVIPRFVNKYVTASAATDLAGAGCLVMILLGVYGYWREFIRAAPSSEKR